MRRMIKKKEGMSEEDEEEEKVRLKRKAPTPKLTLD